MSPRIELEVESVGTDSFPGHSTIVALPALRMWYYTQPRLTERANNNHSLRRPKPPPLRNHLASLRHLLPPLLPRPRAPRHRPAARPTGPNPTTTTTIFILTYLASPHRGGPEIGVEPEAEILHPEPKRPLPSQPARQVPEPAGLGERRAARGAGAGDAGVCAWGCGGVAG